MAKDGQWKTVLWMVPIIALLVVLALLFAWVFQNKTTQGVYDIGACTINDYGCNGGDWDGVCTGDIEDECCEDIRMCSGQVVTNPVECFTYYCANDNRVCWPYEDVATDVFTCNCKSVNDIDIGI